MSTTAHDVIWPSDTNILVRVVFLYVGQGDSAVVLVRDGDTYRTLLVDINRDEKHGGIDVPLLVEDLLKDEGGELGVFVNTHPHNDHLSDVAQLSKVVDILEVWHSKHKPSKKHDDAYKNLQKVIKQVTKKHGTDAETHLLGSGSSVAFGDAEYHILSPAEYVVKEIDGETEDARKRRIHEQCAVIKFGSGSTWIMLDGDADRDAWENHITDYDEDRLKAQVLSAAHHGSKTFFRYNDEDDAYLDALQKIAPDYVVISAPTQEESPHGHPHDDAVGFYEDEVGKDNVLHNGANRESFICDIFSDGTYTVEPDTDLVDEYGLGHSDTSEESKSNSSKKAKSAGPAIVTGTRIDRRPMGANQ